MTEENVAGPEPQEHPPGEAVPPPGDQPAAQPGWWHRSHPTFASLTGFYGGMVFIIVVPGLWAGLCAALFGQSEATRLFPLVLISLIVPLALLVPRHTRRFALFIWVGIISTVVVVLGAAALTLWLLIK